MQCVTMASKLLRWERSTPTTADANTGKALSKRLLASGMVTFLKK